MDIIPAIDIQNGKCVRLQQGDFKKETIFSENPIEMAKKWATYGIRRLHIVDLDGAKLGKPTNQEIIFSISSSFPDLSIQIGGGIRSKEDAEMYFDSGIKYIIIGSKAVEDINFVEDLCKSFKNKIIVGIDAKNGFVATDGWSKSSKIGALELAKKVENFGVKEIIYTDIEKDGMMMGPNIESILKLSESINIPIIASGGITTIDDIKKISGYSNLGISGMIIGRALYENKINVTEAQKILNNIK
ncbi:MAG: 1-(5-phosphoribosyl)-5-[(5-phosphoribosylamino)methylideneamino]imidazole-4-carboxamide isomerase [Gammaproteobacteria bacterium]|nr:1-(5-phosphoribosyl)-5-[(5-phosphoribosylamino)methylideneamino]imidazole-4-carboxamide isomerase [Gammaproteobacteria bacterium]